ncbi:MAG: ABC transporter permease subunit [Actinomycetota bacterium]|nr:ABC transporter permease subunit [Actinomycetota bacterium]
MSTTTTNVRPHEQVAAEPGVAGTGSLFRAELHRFRARRFIQLLLALSVLAFLAGTVVAYTQHSKPTPAILAEARAEMQEQMRMAEESRQQCLQDESIPEAEREMACGPPPSEQGMELEWFLDKRAFVLAENIATGVVAGSVVTAALLFVIGATFIGAEWSTRSIVALLFWQPRRLKVLAVKAAVTALVATVLAVAAQAAWTAAAMLLAKLRGTTDVPKEFWSNVLEAQGRGVLLVVLFAPLGLGMANLLRNTGAALGVAFAYLIIVENAVRSLYPKGAQYLLTENAIALVQSRGHRIFVDDSYVDRQGNFVDGREIVLSNLHGGLVLAAVTAAVLALGTYLFRRRDLQ